MSDTKCLGDGETLILRNLEETILEPVSEELSLVPVDKAMKENAVLDTIIQMCPITFCQSYFNRRSSCKALSCSMYSCNIVL